MNYIAPTWARVLIAPLVAFLYLLGLGLLLGGIYEAFNRSRLEGMLLVLLGLFFLFLGRQGICLYTYRNIRACINGKSLDFSDGPMGKVNSFPLSDIVIDNVRWIQLIHISSVSTGKRLMSIDYYYSAGVSLVMEIQKRLSEQSGPAYPPQGVGSADP